MKYVLFLPFLLLSGSFVSEAPKKPPFRPGKDFALFFAVKDYDQPKTWPKLKNPIRDAEALAEVLRDQYGFEAPEIHPNPTKEKIQEVLYRWQQKTFEPDAQLFIFFSGHGDFNEVSKKGFFIPRDGQANDRYGNSYISYPDLERDISAIPCRHILLGLDACYSGAFDAGIALGKNPRRPGETDETIRQRRIEDKLRDQSRFVFTSGEKRRTSDGIEHSPLVERLLKILRNGDPETGFITADELKAALQKITPKPPFLPFEGHETDGDFLLVEKVFGKKPPEPDATKPRDPDQAACDYARRQNSEEVWQLYLNDPGNQACREEAKRALAQYKETRAWQNALNTGTPTAFDYYKNIYCPGGQYCNEVEERLKTRNDNMLLIKGGSFQMGSSDGGSDEKPVHSVTVSDFYLGKYEVTVAEFRAFVDATKHQTDAEKDGGSYGYEGTAWKKIAGRNWRHDPEGNPAKDNHPVINVSWNDAVAYCKWLSNKTAQAYRLPTEAEWEYAAGNGAKHSKYSWGNSDPNGKKGGNVADKTGKAKFSDWTIFENYTDGYVFTAPVGSFDANDFGLHDMSGNVWEWCSDWYGSDYYKNSPASNPQGASSGSDRVMRGGSWSDDPQNCRVAVRYGDAPGNRGNDVGFRLARTK